MAKKLLTVFLCVATMAALSACGKTADVTVNENISTEDQQNDQDSVQENGTETAQDTETKPIDSSNGQAGTPITLDAIPAYGGDAYIEVNDGDPAFTDAELKEATEYFLSLSDLDSLGRCGAAMISADAAHMPTEKRGEIGQVKPSGWHTANYHGLVDGNYLYNRCHLLMYHISGLNAEERNLITGTRYLNIEGMLPTEEMIANYIEDHPNQHVLYRVTPFFTKDNLVADGVLMEAESVEDAGEGLSVCIYAYNVQPGIVIDYATGESEVSDTSNTDTESKAESDASNAKEETFILNTNSGVFHLPGCESVSKMSDKNKQEITSTYDEMLNGHGYKPCSNCLADR